MGIKGSEYLKVAAYLIKYTDPLIRDSDPLIPLIPLNV